jgi:hypothetical protein
MIILSSEPMRIFLMGHSESYSLQKQSGHNRTIATRKCRHQLRGTVKKLQLQLCEIFDVSSRGFGRQCCAYLKCFLRDCHCLSTTELRGTMYSDVWYDVGKLYAYETGAPF